MQDQHETDRRKLKRSDEYVCWRCGLVGDLDEVRPWPWEADCVCFDCIPPKKTETICDGCDRWISSDPQPAAPTACARCMTEDEAEREQAERVRARGSK